MLPAMCPPPMPVKLFELAAGVFEMRAVSYFLAITTGKFCRFLVESLLVIFYGPAVLEMGLHFVRRHMGAVLGVVGAVVIGLGVYMLRMVFDRRQGVALPVEEEIALSEQDAL